MNVIFGNVEVEYKSDERPILSCELTMPYRDFRDDMDFGLGGFTEPSSYLHDDTIDAYKFALNAKYGIDTDNINDMWPKVELLAARGNGKTFWSMKKWHDYLGLRPTVEKVIFNGPATIVLWTDGTKTVVKCEDEEFDKEKGLAMAITKRFLGTNKSGSNYYDIFKKWIPEEETVEVEHYDKIIKTEKEKETTNKVVKKVKKTTLKKALGDD